MPVKSRFQTVTLNTNGGSYQSRLIPLSAQRSFNMYPEATPEGISMSVMHAWPGFLTAQGGGFLEDPVRGCHVFQGQLYAVVGDELKRMPLGSSSSVTIGTVEVTGDDPVSMEDNGDVMIICGGATPYQYNGTALTAVSGVDFNPTKVQFLNERFYLNGDDGGIAVSDVLSTNFDSANVFYGRSTPEPTITHYIFNQIIYLFDENSIEPWQDVATGSPPAARINQGIMSNIGCISVNGVTSTDSAMYFIAADGNAYKVSGFGAQEITNSVISSHFRDLDVSKIYADYVSVNGEKFVLFNFLEDSECWVYAEGSGAWFEVGTDGEGYEGLSFVFFGGEWLCGSREFGNILQLAPDLDTFSTDAIVRERVISTISGDDIQQPGVMLEMSRIRFSVETGAGTNTDLKEPQMMLVPSFDGGYTFSAPILLDLGYQGEYTIPVELCMMQQFRRAVFKIRVTDYIDKFAIYSASIDIRKAGH